MSNARWSHSTGRKPWNAKSREESNVKIAIGSSEMANSLEVAGNSVASRGGYARKAGWAGVVSAIKPHFSSEIRINGRVLKSYTSSRWSWQKNAFAAFNVYVERVRSFAYVTSRRSVKLWGVSGCVGGGGYTFPPRGITISRWARVPRARNPPCVRREAKN